MLAVCIRSLSRCLANAARAISPRRPPVFPLGKYMFYSEPDQSGDAGIKDQHHAALVTSVLFTWMLKALISNITNFERYMCWIKVFWCHFWSTSVHSGIILKIYPQFHNDFVSLKQDGRTEPRWSLHLFASPPLTPVFPNSATSFAINSAAPPVDKSRRSLAGPPVSTSAP